MVNRPAKVDVLESHNGADTMPVTPATFIPSAQRFRSSFRNFQHRSSGRGRIHAILDQDIQAFLNRQRGIEDNKTETEGEDVVAVADFEEIADGALH